MNIFAAILKSLRQKFEIVWDQQWHVFLEHGSAVSGVGVRHPVAKAPKKEQSGAGSMVRIHIYINFKSMQFYLVKQLLKEVLDAIVRLAMMISMILKLSQFRSFFKFYF